MDHDNDTGSLLNLSLYGFGRNGWRIMLLCLIFFNVCFDEVLVWVTVLLHSQGWPRIPSNQSWALTLTFSHSALCPAEDWEQKVLLASFTFPGLLLWVSSPPRQPRKPLSFSDIQWAADTSWESLKSFPKEATLQQMPIFRLHKAHIRFLLPLSLPLCSKPAVWKTAGSFVFKVQHCLASSHLELYSPGMHWGLFFPHSDRTPNHR